VLEWHQPPYDRATPKIPLGNWEPQSLHIGARTQAISEQIGSNSLVAWLPVDRLERSYRT